MDTDTGPAAQSRSLCLRAGVEPFVAGGVLRGTLSGRPAQGGAEGDQRRSRGAVPVGACGVIAYGSFAGHAPEAVASAKAPVPVYVVPEHGTTGGPLPHGGACLSLPRRFDARAALDQMAAHRVGVRRFLCPPPARGGAIEEYRDSCPIT